MPIAEYGGFVQNLSVSGRSGALVWGYKPAATLGTWRAERRRDSKEDPWTWTLRATLAAGAAIDRFALRQRPLLFTAPRRGGFFTFPVHRLDVFEATSTITASLGPPEY